MSGDSPLVLFVGGVPFSTTPEEMTQWFTDHGLSAGSVKNVDLPAHADSGRKKGFAVVTFDNAASVTKAIALDKADMGGRYLNIRAYTSEPPVRADREPRAKKPRAPREPRADGVAAGGASSSAPRTRAPRTRKPKAARDAAAGGDAAASSSASRPARAPRAPREPRAEFKAPEGWKVVFVGNLPWSATEEQLAALLANGGGCTVRLGWDAKRNRAKGFAHIEFESGDAAAAAVKRSGVEMEGRALRIEYAPERTEPAAQAQAQA